MPRIDLAFEHFTTTDAPPTLYRVRWTRTLKQDRKIQSVAYFIDETAAWKHAGGRIEAGHEVNGVDVYEMKSPAPPEPRT